MERGKLGKRKDPPFLTPAGRWFLSWPIFISLGLHGLMVCFLLTWGYPRPAENPPRVVMVQIVEGEKKKVQPPPSPVQPKPKKVPKREQPKPEPPTIVFPKEGDAPSLSSSPVADPIIPEVTRALEEKIKNDELPAEQQKEKAKPANLGVAEGQVGFDGASLGTAPGVAENPGLAEKGIPGGLPSATFWGKGTGGEGGVAGGRIGEKGAIPGKGVKTGSVYFQSEGKGNGDLGSYLGSARLKIEKAKRYPREACRRGWEGKVVVSFQINRQGEAAEIRLIQSSGYRDLDEEGVATIRRASPFFPPPLGEKEKIEVEIPLLFRFEGNR